MADHTPPLHEVLRFLVAERRYDQVGVVSETLEAAAAALEARAGAVVDGVDVPRAWPQEALDGPKSEPEALVAWLATARQAGAEELVRRMQQRLDRLEELRP